MATIATNLQAVRARIERAATAVGRPPADIALVAVSKTFPAEHIAQAHAAGQKAFGENYAREAVEKITKLAHLSLNGRVAQARRENESGRNDAHPSVGVASPIPHSFPLSRGERGRLEPPFSTWEKGGDEGTGPLLLPLEWHFIGPIQSNKTSAIAAHFQWVHSVERVKIAQRLDAMRPEGLPPLEVCIQVNVSGEASKSGISPGEEIGLAEAIARLPRLRLRGLMAIPEPSPDIKLQHRRFALLRELRDGLVARGYALDTLSMGMSDDLEAAIAEGATMVRVGTAIFGKRER